MNITTSKYMPDDMAVMFGADGTVAILDLKTGNVSGGKMEIGSPIITEEDDKFRFMATMRFKPR